MRFRSPKMLPNFKTLIDDLPSRNFAKIGKHFGYAESTLQKFYRDDEAPLCLMKALYWETQWGVSQNDVELYNLAQVHRACAKSSEALIKQLHERIDAMQNQMQPTDCANTPFYDPYRQQPSRAASSIDRSARGLEYNRFNRTPHFK